MRYFALILLPSLLVAQQVKIGPPRSDTTISPVPASDPGDLASLQGRVVNGATDAAVREAELELARVDAIYGVTPGLLRVKTFSDENGVFAFADLEPGKYRLLANHRSFARTEYGAREGSRMGPPILLGKGERRGDLVLRLAPQSVIVGRVEDENGERIAGARVQVVRLTSVQGRKQLTPVQTGVTNDLGEYRLAGLSAGTYYVVAKKRGPGAPVARARQEVAERADYVLTYYPRNPHLQGASPIELPSGVELPNVVVTLVKLRTVSVRGRIISPPLKVKARIQLIPRDGIGLAGAYIAQVVGNDGSFELSNVPPGSYHLVVYTEEGYHSTRLPVEVAASDIENLTVRLAREIEVFGRVRLDGEAGSGLAGAGIRVRHVPIEPVVIQIGDLPVAEVEEDGTFRTEVRAADHYRLELAGLPDGVYLKSIRSGLVDVLASGLDLTAGAPAPVEIVLSPKAGTLAGTVRHPGSGEPVPDATVVLVPEEADRRGRAEWYRAAPTNGSGVFEFTSLPPGQYKLLAWDHIDPGAYLDPEFVEPVAAKSVKLTVEEGSHHRRELTAVLAEAR